MPILPARPTPRFTWTPLPPSVDISYWKTPCTRPMGDQAESLAGSTPARASYLSALVGPSIAFGLPPQPFAKASLHCSKGWDLARIRLGPSPAEPARVASLRVAIIVLPITESIAEVFGERGYIIQIVSVLTGSRALGGLVSFLGALAIHVPQVGWEYVTAGMASQLVFVLLYLWRRNVWSCALAHALIDCYAFWSGGRTGQKAAQ